MAKIGIEVEGKYVDTDLKTLFCSAEEWMCDLHKMAQLANAHEVEHIYISDHHNELDLYELSSVIEYLGDVLVTVELTELNELPPENIEIFWNVSQASYAQSRTMLFLRPSDQIKVEHEKHVLSWLVGKGTFTLPEDFEGDITV